MVFSEKKPTDEEIQRCEEKLEETTFVGGDGEIGKNDHGDSRDLGIRKKKQYPV